MRKKSVYLIRFRRAIFRTTSSDGFILGDLIKYYDSFIESVKQGERAFHLLGTVFSSECKAKSFCDLHNEESKKLEKYIGEKEFVCIEYSYFKTTLL